MLLLSLIFFFFFWFFSNLKQKLIQNWYLKWKNFEKKKVFYFIFFIFFIFFFNEILKLVLTILKINEIKVDMFYNKKKLFVKFEEGGI